MGQIANLLGMRVGKKGGFFWSNNFSFFFDGRRYKKLTHLFRYLDWVFKYLQFSTHRIYSKPVFMSLTKNHNFIGMGEAKSLIIDLTFYDVSGTLKRKPMYVWHAGEISEQSDRLFLWRYLTKKRRRFRYRQNQLFSIAELRNRLVFDRDPLNNRSSPFENGERDMELDVIKNWYLLSPVIRYHYSRYRLIKNILYFYYGSSLKREGGYCWIFNYMTYQFAESDFSFYFRRFTPIIIRYEKEPKSVRYPRSRSDPNKRHIHHTRWRIHTYAKHLRYRLILFKKTSNYHPRPISKYGAVFGRAKKTIRLFERSNPRSQLGHGSVLGIIFEAYGCPIISRKGRHVLSFYNKCELRTHEWEFLERNISLVRRFIYNNKEGKKRLRDSNLGGSMRISKNSYKKRWLKFVFSKWVKKKKDVDLFGKVIRKRRGIKKITRRPDGEYLERLLFHRQKSRFNRGRNRVRFYYRYAGNSMRGYHQKFNNLMKCLKKLYLHISKWGIQMRISKKWIFKKFRANRLWLEDDAFGLDKLRFRTWLRKSCLSMSLSYQLFFKMFLVKCRSIKIVFSRFFQYVIQLFFQDIFTNVMRFCHIGQIQINFNGNGDFLSAQFVVDLFTRDT